jgi:transcription initiation factor TFIID subunit 2
LAQSVISTSDQQFSFHVADYDQESRDIEFQRAAIEEIRRFQRTDEWIPSYQNIYTVTALESLTLLMQKEAAPRRISEIMQYTNPKNSAAVRLKAFECLIELGMFSNPAILNHFFATIVYDPSPYFRDRIWHIVGKGLGRVALIEPLDEPEAPTSDFVVDATDSSRAAALERTESIEAAQKVLAKKIGGNELLKETILDGLRYVLEVAAWFTLKHMANSTPVGTSSVSTTTSICYLSARCCISRLIVSR